MNQKGGVIVEAALVFPLIILSLMATITILTFLFEEAATQAEVHLVIRSEAGRLTGTFHGQPGSSSIAVNTGIMGIHHIMKGRTLITFEGSNMLSGAFQKEITGYQYITDERKYARYVDYFSWIQTEDGDHEDKAVR